MRALLVRESVYSYSLLGACSRRAVVDYWCVGYRQVAIVSVSLTSLSLILLQAMVKYIGLMLVLPGGAVILCFVHTTCPCPGFVGGREGKHVPQSYVL